METTMMSFDSSTKKTGVAIFKNGELNDYKLLDYSEIKDQETRVEKMCKDIWKQLCEYSPTIVYAEDTWNKLNISTSKLLTNVLGVIHAWCIANDAEYHVLLPSQWRKLAGIEQGKKERKELKQASIDYVKAKYHIDVNDDVADAITLGDAVMNYFAEV